MIIEKLEDAYRKKVHLKTVDLVGYCVGVDQDEDLVICVKHVDNGELDYFYCSTTSSLSFDIPTRFPEITYKEAFEFTEGLVKRTPLMRGIKLFKPEEEKEDPFYNKYLGRSVLLI